MTGRVWPPRLVRSPWLRPGIESLIHLPARIDIPDVGVLEPGGSNPAAVRSAEDRVPPVLRDSQQFPARRGIHDDELRACPTRQSGSAADSPRRRAFSRRPDVFPSSFPNGAATRRPDWASKNFSPDEVEAVPWSRRRPASPRSRRRRPTTGRPAPARTLAGGLASMSVARRATRPVRHAAGEPVAGLADRDFLDAGPRWSTV